MNPTDNTANLPEGYIENTLSSLSDRQRRRFLNGQWLDDSGDGLWNATLIDRSRVAAAPAELERIVIGVDPAVTSGSRSDFTGIVAAGKDRSGCYYVLADKSLQGSPLTWAQTVKKLFEDLNADRVVGEVNQGGDLIEMALHNTAPTLPFKAVRAMRGKLLRAEPIAALYEQNKVHHVGYYPELEEEMCNYRANSSNSPDRLDALVWALTELASDNSGNRSIMA